MIQFIKFVYRHRKSNTTYAYGIRPKWPIICHCFAMDKKTLQKMYPFLQRFWESVFKKPNHAR